LTKNCKLQFFQRFGQFCTQRCDFARGNLKPDLGLELGVLSGPGIENRVISRAIGL
jgi:hypothetical protein